MIYEFTNYSHHKIGDGLALPQGQPIVVTRDNDTVAVMLSPKQYQQILSLFEELEDQRAAKRLEKAIQRGGKFIDFNTFDERQRKRD